MGNSAGGRLAGTAGIAGAGIALAPFTGGISAVIGTTAAVARYTADYQIEKRCTHWADMRVHNISPDDPAWDDTVTCFEVRYCHINGVVGDFGVTLAGRALLMTTDASHHHFIIITMRRGTMVYLDKHGYRNLKIVDNKLGLSLAGKFDEPSESLQRYLPRHDNITLRNVYDIAREDKYGSYHLLDKNCQNFTKAIIDWFCR